jgi:hypothetical protein
MESIWTTSIRRRRTNLVNESPRHIGDDIYSVQTISTIEEVMVRVQDLLARMKSAPREDTTNDPAAVKGSLRVPRHKMGKVGTLQSRDRIYFLPIIGMGDRLLQIMADDIHLLSPELQDPQIPRLKQLDPLLTYPSLHRGLLKLDRGNCPTPVGVQLIRQYLESQILGPRLRDET